MEWSGRQISANVVGHSDSSLNTIHVLVCNSKKWKKLDQKFEFELLFVRTGRFYYEKEKMLIENDLEVSHDDI